MCVCEHCHTKMTTFVLPKDQGLGTKEVLTVHGEVTGVQRHLEASDFAFFFCCFAVYVCTYIPY